MSEKCKTTPQENRGKKPNWRCGAPTGNRNAAKAVPTLPMQRVRIRALKRRAKAVMATVPGQAHLPSVLPSAYGDAMIPWVHLDTAKVPGGAICAHFRIGELGSACVSAMLKEFQ